MALVEAEKTVDLFSPISLGRITLPSRIVMAPMTRSRADADRAPHDLNVQYYSQRASGGLIITEATQISPQGIGYAATPGIHTQPQIDGWKRVTEAVHNEGGRIFLQLWHVGRISHPSLLSQGELPVAPSAIKPDGEVRTPDGPKPYVTPRALTTDEIEPIVANYGQAAENAIAAEFDGVEIHAANGYLIDQFLRDGTNQRTDGYGGSLPNRVRFLREITQSVTEAVGADRVGVRLSPEGSFNSMSDSDPAATFGAAVETLNPFGLAYLHVVEDPSGVPFDWQALRRAFDGPYMANSEFSKESGNEALAAGRADLISFGRPYLANPDLPERFAADAPLNAPNPDTLYGGGAEGYTDYSRLGAKAA
jgi:N-ethylmaleimide reductase